MGSNFLVNFETTDILFVWGVPNLWELNNSSYSSSSSLKFYISTGNVNYIVLNVVDRIFK